VPLAGDQVDDAAGHRDGVVGEALVVAADQRDVDRRLHPVVPVLAEQHREHLTVQAVHLVVVLLELDRGVQVLARDDAAGLGHDPLGHLAHLEDRGAQHRRDGRVGVAPAGHLGDVAGEVAHPLEVRAHPHAGDDDPQVGGDRLLLGQQHDRGVVELALQGVDLLVGGDDALGQTDVGVQQRGGRAGHRRAGQPGHLDQLVGGVVELLVEGVAHERAGSSRGLMRAGFGQ